MIENLKISEFYVSQIQIAEKFFRHIKEYFSLDSDSEKMSVIVINKEENSNHNYSFYLKEVEVPEEKKTTITNCINKFKEIILENEGVNFYINCQEILSLIEIILNDIQDNIKIDNKSIADSDFKFLRIEKTFKLAIEMTTQQDFDMYYRADEIYKFKFKLEKYPENLENPQNTENPQNQQMFIDDNIINSDINTILIGSENYLNDFFHNIRAFLGTILGHLYLYTVQIKSKCSKVLIESRMEVYYGLLQMMICPDLISLMRHSSIETILAISSNKHVIEYQKFKMLMNDMDIYIWANYMANIQPLISEFEKSHSIRINIDKFLLLLVWSYENLSEYEENEFEQSEKELIIRCIEACNEVIKSEADLSKPIREWKVFYWLKMLLNIPSVNFYILKEVETKIISMIINKSEKLQSKIKIEELSNKLERQLLKDEDINLFLITVDRDIKILKNFKNFLFHIDWIEDCQTEVIKASSTINQEILKLVKLKEDFIKNK
jgi:hypothetical protein